MERTKYLIVGAGISGLAFANFIDSDDYLILERDGEIGGYCKTVYREGFTWDYSGHFFHFRYPEIRRLFLDRMVGEEIRTVEKVSKIYYSGTLVDFPFQKNIHQLPREDFLDCLYHLFFRPQSPSEGSFYQMVYSRFGKGIAERFLIPYNEKLYACDLRELDASAMGRFFPYADLEEIIKNFKYPDNSSYNSTFDYPRKGAIAYVNALASALDPEKIALNEELLQIDLRNKVAVTSTREIQFEYLISSMPFPRLLERCALSFDPQIFRWNRVLVFNLGFAKKGPRNIHWIYFPQRELPFYRVGFYDNIFDEERMSIYVEIGLARDSQVEPERALNETLKGLEKVGILEDNELVASHRIVLDPAYVHITAQSVGAVEHYKKLLAPFRVFSIGRYGSWTYCSIEDNVVEARETAKFIAQLESI